MRAEVGTRRLRAAAMASRAQTETTSGRDHARLRQPDDSAEPAQGEQRGRVRASLAGELPADRHARGSDDHERSHRDRDDAAGATVVGPAAERDRDERERADQVSLEEAV